MLNFNEILKQDVKVQAKFLVNEKSSFAVSAISSVDEIVYEERTRKAADEYHQDIPFETFSFKAQGYVLPADPAEQTTSPLLTVEVRGVVRHNDDALDTWSSIVKLCQKAPKCVVKGNSLPVLIIAPAFVPVALDSDIDAVAYLSGIAI